MTKRKILFWTTTIWVAGAMGVSGLLAVTHAGAMMKALAHLGYPAYFANLLGAAKLAGVVVLLVPAYVRLKEWAYAGFGIVVLSAAYSHLLSGDGVLRTMEPLLTLAALVVSYLTSPEGRRYFPALRRTAERSRGSEAREGTGDVQLQ